MVPHISVDDMDLVSRARSYVSYGVMMQMIDALEYNEHYEVDRIWRTIAGI